MGLSCVRGSIHYVLSFNLLGCFSPSSSSGAIPQRYEENFQKTSVQHAFFLATEAVLTVSWEWVRVESWCSASILAFCVANVFDPSHHTDSILTHCGTMDKFWPLMVHKAFFVLFMANIVISNQGLITRMSRLQVNYCRIELVRT